jgi:opacity protein-like surface antigen
MKISIKTIPFLSAILISSAAFAQADSTEYKHYRFGGYGEMLFQRMNYGADRYKDPTGAPRENRSYISIPRTILALDYKFRDDIVLGMEIEFEYGGTGTAMELEYDEAGEYEMEVEKGGEVVLEQFHITKSFAPWFNIRAGHLIVPVGLTNAHHEPIFFFGTTRPEGEMTILPCTWHETGLAVLGVYKGLKYEVMIVNGLDPNGFSSSNWIRSGKQGIFETAVMTSPAYAGRLEYTPIKGLRLGVSGYYNKTAKNASIPQKTTGIDATVSIGSVDLQYQNKNAIVRANLVYGHLTDALRLSQINRNISKNIQFARTPVAENVLTYACEAGYNVLSFFGLKQKLMPFVRYEYYNSAEKVPVGMAEMPINKRNVFTVGANYALLSNLLLKVDYNIRRLDNDNFNRENTFGIAVAYAGWFIRK